MSAQPTLSPSIRAQRSNTASAIPEEGPEVTYYFPVWIVAPCFKDYICLFIVGDCMWVGGVRVLVCTESDNNYRGWFSPSTYIEFEADLDHTELVSNER